MIQDTKTADDEIALENERLRAALQAAGVGTWDFNLITREAQWSPICKELFGLPPDAEVNAAILLAQVHPEDRDAVAQANARSVSPGTSGEHDIVFRTLNPDGAPRWVHAKGKINRDPDGNPIRFSGIVQDVTGQVQDREKLETSEGQLRSIIASAPAAIGLFVGRDLVIELPNQAFIDIVGKGPDIVGKPLREVMPELLTENQPFLQILDEVYTSGQTFQTMGAQVKIVRNGVMTENYYNFTYSPLRNESGQVYAILDIAIDVTEAVLARQQSQESEERYRRLSEELDERVQQRTQSLNEANRNLMRSNENLKEFAYVASHDLQEPLRKIQSFSSILKEQYGPMLDETGVNLLTRLTGASERMSVLIRDLLAYSRISIQAAVADRISLAEVVQRALENLSVSIEESNARISVGELPAIEGDSIQLGQLFQNLLSNALKFRKPGIAPEIRIEAHEVPAGALPAQVTPGRRVASYLRLSVADNGIGFDQKYSDRIFKVFQRLHGKSDFVGSGVGLAICQKVVANHGGALTAHSQPGQGATFCIYLPFSDQ